MQARATGRCEGSGGQRHREVRADLRSGPSSALTPGLPSEGQWLCGSGASQAPPSFGLFLSCVHQQILSGSLGHHHTINNAVSVASNSLAWYGPRDSEKTGICNCIGEGSLAPSWVVASFGDQEQEQKVIMLERSKHSSQDTRNEDRKTMSPTCLMPRVLPRPSLQPQAPLDSRPVN